MMKGHGREMRGNAKQECRKAEIVMGRVAANIGRRRLGGVGHVSSSYICRT